MAEHPTIADPWRPRDERWLARSASRFAGGQARPLLIGGCPRSGTTLLRSLLDNHPEIAIPAETDFLIPLWQGRASYGDLCEPMNRRRVGRFVYHEEGRGGIRLRPTGERERRLTRRQAIDQLVLAPPTIGSLGARVFELYAESHGKPRWGDKRPAYAGYVRALLALFPDAQFVNVVRDPRGAVASLMGLGWHRPEVAAAASAATWEMSIARVDHAARDLRPDQLLDVRYEDLVRDPEGVLARVCAFAGLPAEDEHVGRMLTGERGGRFRPGWHDRLSEPISTAPIDAWRAKLSDAQVALVERAAGSRLERFGYAPVAEGPPAEADLAALDAQRARRVRRWREEDRAERIRRLRYRRPVAALPADPATWPAALRRGYRAPVTAPAA